MSPGRGGKESQRKTDSGEGRQGVRAAAMDSVGLRRAVPWCARLSLAEAHPRGLVGLVCAACWPLLTYLSLVFNLTFCII